MFLSVTSIQDVIEVTRDHGISLVIYIQEGGVGSRIPRGKHSTSKDINKRTLRQFARLN